MIEIMITLVIISVIVGLAIVSFGPNPAKQVGREAARMQLVLSMVADEAIMQGNEYALALENDGYQFLVFDATKRSWMPVTTEVMAPYQLPEGITLSLQIDGDSVDDEVMVQIQKLQQLNQRQTLQPTLLLLSSGELTPFKMAFLHEVSGSVQTLSSDGVSGIYLQ